MHRKESKKLKEDEDGPTWSGEQRKEYKDRKLE